MKRRKLKKFVLYGMYAMSIMMLLGGVYFVESIIDNKSFQSDEVEVMQEVDDVVDDKEDSNVPVVSVDVKIIRPYIGEEVKILKNYYDYKGDANSQEESIVYYGNTYMQNSGVDYGMGEAIDVVSILDGVVMEVVDDDILGKTIKIKHNNDLISVYQSMGEVNVSVDDKVMQGMIIGKSGESNVSSDLGNHLHFELYHNGNVVNPEEYYDKLVGELQ